MLEERRFERLGGNKSMQVDFRLISATNRPLDSSSATAASARTSITASTRSRSGCPRCASAPVDIRVLANRFLARYCAANGLPLDAKTFSPEALGRLKTYPLARKHPRAREHGLARGAVGARTDHSRHRHRVSASARPLPPQKRRRGCRRSREAERAHIIRVLDAAAWNKKEAARVLEISRGTLYRKIVEYGLEPNTRMSRNRAAQ